MSEFYEEINSYRHEKESNRKFAGRLGVHPSMLKYWEKGMIPKEETITRVANALGIDKRVRNQWIEWAQCMTGESEEKPKAKLALVKRAKEKENRQEENQKEENRVDLQRNENNRDFYEIPCVSPLLDDEKLQLSTRDAWFRFRSDWIHSAGSGKSNLFLKIVWEKDMEPDLRPGDVVLVDTGMVGYEDGGIYAVQSDGFIILRRLTLLRGGRIRISSDANRSDFIEGIPGDEIKLIGRVIWMARSL